MKKTNLKNNNDKIYNLYLLEEAKKFKKDLSEKKSIWGESEDSFKNLNLKSFKIEHVITKDSIKNNYDDSKIREEMKFIILKEISKNKEFKKILDYFSIS